MHIPQPERTLTISTVRLVTANNGTPRGEGVNIGQCQLPVFIPDGIDGLSNNGQSNGTQTDQCLQLLTQHIYMHRSDDPIAYRPPIKENTLFLRYCISNWGNFHYSLLVSV